MKKKLIKSTKVRKYIPFSLIAVLVFVSCDSQLDITPKGQSTLSTANELEQLFNNDMNLGLPASDLGIICNETLGQMINVPTELLQKNTRNNAWLTYDESIDRAALTLTDDRYNDGYKFISYMNTIIAKMPDASGSDAKKKGLIAEAHIMRAYLHWLLVNIYAKQYVVKTANTEGGIPYVTNLDFMETKQKETLQQVYDKILADCSDEYINALPERNLDVFRGDQAWGNAVRAKVLMQMKRYSEALPYAQKAVALRPDIEDRSSILIKLDYFNQRQSSNNLIYAGATLFTTTISKETAAMFERGDYVKDYAFQNAKSSAEADDDDNNYEENAKVNTFMNLGSKNKSKTTVTDGENVYVPFNSVNPSYSALYGMMMSGVNGAEMYFSMNAWVNCYGITSDRMYYVLAECLIRTGKIKEGLDMVNKVRQKRIHSDYYTPFTADNETEAMALMQKAKWVECIGTYENFFDCKRWNTEDAYRRTITRIFSTVDGNTLTFSLAPDSKIWVFPFPQNAVRRNPSLTQNY